MRTSKLIIIGLASLFLLIASVSESFAVKQYNAAWIAESFGNDKVGIGTEASAFFEALGIPQGILCHPAAPLCSISSTPETTAKAPVSRVFNPLGPGCRPLTAGELPRPAKGGTNKIGGASCPGVPPTSPPAARSLRCIETRPSSPRSRRRTLNPASPSRRSPPWRPSRTVKRRPCTWAMATPFAESR